MTKGKGEKQAPKSSLEGIVTHRKGRLKCKSVVCETFHSRIKAAPASFLCLWSFTNKRRVYYCRFKSHLSWPLQYSEREKPRIKFCDLLNVKA